VDPRGAPIVARTLWVSHDEGASWRAAAPAEIRESDGEIRFLAPSDGRYGFRITARDQAGLEGAPPGPGSAPEILVAVDSVAPAVKIVAPSDGMHVRSGSPVTVQWEVTDGNAGAHPVSILVSYDGADAVPASTALPPSGTHVLHPPQKALKMQITVAAVDLARNRGESSLVRLTLSPTAQPMVPAPAPHVAETPIETRPSFNVWYRVQDAGPSGLREINLWYTLDNGASWSFYGKDEDLVPPFAFVPPRPGRYGFYLDAVKMTEPFGGVPPASGAKPHVTALYDPMPPVVALHSPKGGEFVKGGDTLEIRWSATDDLFGDKPITLWYALHLPHWQKIAEGVENTGVYQWTVPKADTTGLHVRVSATDLAGQTTQSEPSGRITVDSQGRADLQVVGVQQTGGPAGAGAGARGDVKSLGSIEAARISYEQGQYYMEIEKDPLKAQAAFQEALRLHPTYLDALNDLGVLFYRGGLYAQALDTFVRTKAVDGATPRVLINLALCYRRVERYDDALAQMEGLTAQQQVLSVGDATEAGTLLIGLTKDFLRKQNLPQARTAALLAAGLPNVPHGLVSTARALAP
jgi:hypothetical protein